MQYLLMIYQNEAEYGKIDAATGKKMLEEYGAFTQGIIQSGNFKAGDRLQPTTTATTVRVRDGKTLTTDGPFAETRERIWMQRWPLPRGFRARGSARSRSGRFGFITNGKAVIPGWSEGPDLRCAIAHRGISRFRVRPSDAPERQPVAPP